jgi:hypothetical protein
MTPIRYDEFGGEGQRWAWAPKVYPRWQSLKTDEGNESDRRVEFGAVESKARGNKA